MTADSTARSLGLFLSLACLAPHAAPAQVVADAFGTGTIPAGEYAGQAFSVSIQGAYSGLGNGTLISGDALVLIGPGGAEETFTAIVDCRAGFESFCAGEGHLFENGFSMTGRVLHDGHEHLFGASATTDGFMCFNIADQTGTVTEPADPTLAHDPGVGLICGIEAVVQIGTVQVAIDIRPGDFPNRINVRSRGLIAVAILTTPDFDATTIDPATVRFGPAGAAPFRGVGHAEDVDGDGDLDLVLHFRTQETGIAAGDTSATLTGETSLGVPIEGSDSIVAF
jgi:hypothetical protein